jgi:hypothetical protein
VRLERPSPKHGDENDLDEVGETMRILTRRYVLAHN